jgi:RHS repeat-associated protein
VASRHDFLPFGEELTTSNRTAALDYGVTDNVMQKYTGKERDLEGPGLDFFHARYFQGAQGRFTGPDSKQFTKRTVVSPRKWNKYGYAQNNPLNSIDPDGLDDYKVFIAAPQAGGGDWKSAQLAAEANGHTLQVFQGDQATLANWNKALGDPAARAVFVGHSTHNDTGTTGVRLIDGVSAGTVSQTDDQSLSATVAGVTVNANTVALFGCDTQAIMGQYGPDGPLALGSAFVVGVDSGENRVSSLEAMGMAAAAFVAADATGSPDPVGAANSAFQQNRRKEDLDGDKIVPQKP